MRDEVDRRADQLRRTHLRALLGPETVVLDWRYLQPYERAMWRSRARERTPIVERTANEDRTQA